MKRKLFDTGTTYWGLQCPFCGNKDRFVEVMAYEYHEVDGRLNYRHLLVSEAAEYRCSVCDEILQPANHPFEE